MRRACIDIGSNTTRLLVAECEPGQLLEIHQERAFTRIGRELRANGAIPPAKIAEVVQVVAEQLRSARDLGAGEIRGVATAAIRRAANGPELIEAILADCGLRVNVLSGAEEARLAFVGAAGTLGRTPAGTLGVVDVGGGSSELVIGRAPDQVSWSTSLRLGSGDLSDGCLLSDPPSAQELTEARARVKEALGDINVPHPSEAVAVGGSAASLRRLAGPVLDPETFTRSLGLLASVGATEVARRFSLDRERVRLLPAGLLILQAAAERFGTALQIAQGGVREGVLLEASA
jgi:exopolyphosphatase/guanosine-5'-triphosphate,3'-diphosphate pyrophosphatase